MTRWFHGISRDLLRASFSEYFGVDAEYVEILVVLYGRPHESVPTKKLRVLLNSHRPPTAGAVYERVRVLREVMEPESIDSGGQLDPTGYSLTEVGYAECRKALLHMAEVLLKHGAQAMEDVKTLTVASLQTLPAPILEPEREPA